MIIDVPHKDEKGNLVFTMSLNEEQTQAILQFGLNFLVASGLAANFGIIIPGEDEDATPAQLDD